MRGDPEAVALSLGLKRSGGEWKGPCPLCGGDDRFHVRRGRHYDLIVLCRAGCEFRDIAAELTARGIIEDDRPRSRSTNTEPADHFAELRAFCASVDRRCPISSRERGRAVQAIHRLTGFSPDEILTMWFWRETYLGNVLNLDVEITENDVQRFNAFQRHLEGREWILRGCAWIAMRR